MASNKDVIFLTVLSLMASLSTAKAKQRKEGWCDDCEKYGVPSMLYSYDPTDDDIFNLRRIPSILPYENEINSWGEVVDPGDFES